jgi:hypothetical protein
MSQRIKRLLKQLRDDEVYELAKTKKIKIPEHWKRTIIIDLLANNVSEKEINSILSGKNEISPQLKGSVLEKRIMEKFSKDGYTVESNTRVKGFAEFDVIGWKEIGRVFKEKHWVFTECKNKSRVIPEDWKKFLGNFLTFKKKYKLSDTDEKVKAYLITTGLFHPEVKKEGKKYPNVKLLRVKG